MPTTNSLCGLLKIDFPLVMAPMFLVSNGEMTRAGMRNGILAAFPSLNYRKTGELEAILDELNRYKQSRPGGNYAVNLIVQRTNPYYKDHLRTCIARKVPVYITSLGNPREVTDAAHSYGGIVFSDVTTLAHAQKCHDAGVDGFVAVGQGAGGHGGPHPLQLLVPALKKRYPGKPVIAAGGIATGAGVVSVMALGADGAYVGTRFIASHECQVNAGYKKAIVESGLEDIVLTSRLSGTPCSVIDTADARKIGLSQTWFEKFMSNNPRTKKWFKALVQARGMSRLEQSVLPNNYSRLWSAGKSVELIDDLLSCEEIITKIKEEHGNTIRALSRS